MFFFLDIVFPTNFNDFTKLYSTLTGRPEDSLKYEPESNFLQKYTNPYYITFEDGTIGKYLAFFYLYVCLFVLPTKTEWY